MKATLKLSTFVLICLSFACSREESADAKVDQVEALLNKYDVPADKLDNLPPDAFDTVDMVELENSLRSYSELRLSLQAGSLTEAEDKKLKYILEQLDRAPSEQARTKVREDHTKFLESIRMRNRKPNNQ